MAETYPVSIPSGSTILPVISGTNLIGSTALPLQYIVSNSGTFNGLGINTTNLTNDFAGTVLAVHGGHITVGSTQNNNNVMSVDTTTGGQMCMSINDTAGFIGTKNNYPFQFSANNIIYSYLLTNGNFVVGNNAAPISNFQVFQAATAVGTISNSVGGTLVTGVGTQFQNTFKIGDTITANAETRTIAAIANNTGLTTDVWVGANTGIAYTLVGGNRLGVLGNGLVGIGTLIPNSTLTVSGNSTSNPIASFYPNASSTPTLFVSGIKVGVGTNLPDMLLQISGVGQNLFHVQSSNTHAGIYLDAATGGNPFVQFEQLGASKTVIGYDNTLGMFVINADGQSGHTKFAVNTTISSAAVNLGSNQPRANLDISGTVIAGSYNQPNNYPLRLQTPRTSYQITPLAATTVNTIGGPVPSIQSGTFSEPAWTLNPGWMQNIALATGIGSFGGLVGGAAMFANVSGSTPIGGGFNFSTRFYLPDQSYTNPSGCRIFIGMTDQTLTVPVAADNFAGNYIGLQFCTVSGNRQDTNFSVMSKDNTTQNSGTTTINPLSGCVYDFYMSLPPTPVSGTPAVPSAFWSLTNQTSGTTSSGTITANLPLSSTPLQPYFGIATYPSGSTSTAPVHNISYSQIYVESYK